MPSAFDRINNWIRNSVTIKLISIGILILILLIPTSMLQSLVRERQDLFENTIDELSSKWGNRQTIGGPVLSIPYLTPVKDDKGNIEYWTHYVHFLPEELNINGKILPEKRHRRIYVVVLYKSILHIEGKFGIPDFAAAGVDAAACQLDKAFISTGISDLRGVNDNINCSINGKNYLFGPGIPTHDVLESGISFNFPVDSTKEIPFSFDINLNGSSRLAFLPFGKVTNVNLSSPWNTPSFEGSFITDTNTVNDSGFVANWKILQLNRNYPQQGTGSFISKNKGNNNYMPDDNTYRGDDDYSSFGVRLLLPVDEYQKTMRSVKYCIMFIIITFLTFFFSEVLNKKRIHPIQYLLVGFAICLFYVLLLSISEHLSFGLSYLTGCVSIIILISFYAKYVFRNNKLTAIFSFLLTLLYGFFYSLLQLEDYSLLLGSIGLFIILATIMYLTRKVNWYGNTVDG